MPSLFRPLDHCWICGGDQLAPVGHRARFALEAYRAQDPQLAAYSGAEIELRRCAQCGFMQPAAMPTLPRYFDRMYDQRWSDEWIRAEFVAGEKDFIFRGVLATLARLLPPDRRRLLDVGTHVGRLPALARDAGWRAEGVEVNPRTSAYAEREARVPIHRLELGAIAAAGHRYDAVTLIDVLEHIAQPVAALRAAHALLEPGGWIAVKVPHGAVQLRKELLRGRLSRRYRPTVADNLVHVNHFTPESLDLALRSAGYEDVRVGVGAPELAGRRVPLWKRWLRNGPRLAAYAAARTVPGAVRSPLGLHLQAYACRG